jgi:diguanylate cyclase (GGDEF)-like protein
MPQASSRAARGRRWRVPAIVGLTIYGGFAVIGSILGVVRGIGAVAEPVFGAGAVLCIFASIGLSLRAATHPKLDARTRSAWRWICASNVLYAVAVVLFSVSSTETFPRPGDLVRLATTAVLIVGIARLPMQPVNRDRRLRLLLDAGTVAAAAGLFLWYLLIVPVFAAGGDAIAARVVVATAYPLANVGAIFVLAMVSMRGINSSARRTVHLLTASTILSIIGESVVGYQNIAPDRQPAVGWEMLVLFTSTFLLCAATFEQIRVAGVGGDIDPHVPRITQVSKLPYGAVAAAFVVLGLAAAEPSFRLPWLGLVLCMAVLTGCVVARQLLAQRENVRIATTDDLTGLVNRVALHEGLSLALARGARSGETTAVLLADLDDFKAVNDTLGHEAGDRLLVAFADALRRSVLGSDVVGRLGGDEFAVVLSDVGTRDNADAVVRRLYKDLEQPVLIGDVVVQVRGSVGVALSGPGELTLDQLMHKADVNMYEMKRARKALQAAESAPVANP